MGENAKNSKPAVESYSFEDFSHLPVHGAGEVKDFLFNELGTRRTESERPEHQGMIRQEREFAEKNSFKFSPIVEKYRGIKNQEEQDIYKKIEEEVVRRVRQIRDEAFREGYKNGEIKGLQEIQSKTLKQSEEKIIRLADMIQEVHAKRDEVFEKQRKQIYELVKVLVKWVLMREVDKDDNYIERLMEKLILEIQERSHLIIRVNEADFTGMPEILETIQNKLGKLTNVRIEINHDLNHKGITIECDSAIIDGTLSSQLELIDRLFESSDAYER